MKNHRILFLLFMFMPLYPLFGQLNTSHNHPRWGDELIKQQVAYIDFTESGKNLIWNLSNLKTINDEYTLSYSLPPLEGDSVYIMGNLRFPKEKVNEGELLVGTEHNTMYYYQLKNDTLYTRGHENPSVRLTYTQPMINIHYPLNYGQSVSSTYQSQGLYSSTVNIQSEGEVTITADAYGKLILPTGDTLTALKTKTVQTILNTNTAAGQNTDTHQLETCRWYAKGYRYPIFETVRSINRNDNTEIFSTAFYYPPQEHFYLDTDPENLALLEDIWDIENKEQNNKQEQANSKAIEIADIMLCKAYPNPVETRLTIEYELKEEAQVSFQLVSMQGSPVKTISKKQQNAGYYHETIDCSGLHQRSYVLRITANNQFVNQTIIKK